jgi:hypothetical protein
MQNVAAVHQRRSWSSNTYSITPAGGFGNLCGLVKAVVDSRPTARDSELQHVSTMYSSSRSNFTVSRADKILLVVVIHAFGGRCQLNPDADVTLAYPRRSLLFREISNDELPQYFDSLCHNNMVMIGYHFTAIYSQDENWMIVCCVGKNDSTRLPRGRMVSSQPVERSALMSTQHVAYLLNADYLTTLAGWWY